MAGHSKQDQRAQSRATRQVAELGRELRLARLEHDLSQRTAASAVGVSGATWSRWESGTVEGVSLLQIIRAFEVVGMDLSARAFPTGHPLRDAAHVRLLSRFRALLGSAAVWRTEVPLPRPGDRRAWDALVTVPPVRIGIEAETRARDSQALQRRLTLKARDGGVDHLILLLADTRNNRTFLRAVGSGFRDDFPVDGTVAMERLALGRDPRGSAIVLL